MMEKQILIVVARADLALTTISREAIVLFAVILMIAAALLLWKAISAVYRRSRRSAHDTNSARSANIAHSPNSTPITPSTIYFSRKYSPEGRRKSE